MNAALVLPPLLLWSMARVMLGLVSELLLLCWVVCSPCMRSLGHLLIVSGRMSNPWSELGCTLCAGVKRAHLLDARQDGGLLLELYSRDGVGTMISADFYEGQRDGLLSAPHVC